jgi:hypothetical protein
MRASALAGCLAAALAWPAGAASQGVVVDQGRFAISLDGRAAGTEEFTIRRAGLEGGAAIFANAALTLTRGGAAQQIEPLLRALPPDGVATQYQVRVMGADSLDLRLRLAQRRYVAAIQSSMGEEQREFPAASDTRVLEVDVAHHYYFLRDLRDGESIPVIEPRIRAHVTLGVGPTTEEELQVGQTVVAARRVELSAGEDRRIVWFDRIGRVLRVEIPGRAYLAERVDLLR